MLIGAVGCVLPVFLREETLGCFILLLNGFRWSVGKEKLRLLKCVFVWRRGQSIQEGSNSIFITRSQLRYQVSFKKSFLKICIRRTTDCISNICWILGAQSVTVSFFNYLILINYLCLIHHTFNLMGHFISCLFIGFSKFSICLRSLCYVIYFSYFLTFTIEWPYFILLFTLLFRCQGCYFFTKRDYFISLFWWIGRNWKNNWSFIASFR